MSKLRNPDILKYSILGLGAMAIVLGGMKDTGIAHAETVSTPSGGDATGSGGADSGKGTDGKVNLTISITPITPAEKVGDQWAIQHPDEGGKTVNVSLPPGFTPDKNLHDATGVTPAVLGRDWANYQDWEALLNTGRPVGDRLAGFNYDYNDFCMVPGFYCNVQADMYAWRVLQGLKVMAPGIGILEGGPRRSVILNVLNLGDTVHPWDVDGFGPVYVKRGFTATGRIFDGDKQIVTEQLLDQHWLAKQFLGEASKSYIGITDSPDNAKEALLVSVRRVQWGFNTDGTKRWEFQLLRSQLISR